MSDVVNRKIMTIVNEWESSDKSDFIEDLLIMVGEDQAHEILFRLENEMPMFGD